VTGEDGHERCVACLMCMFVCPPQAIYIEAEETSLDKERRPRIFDLDFGRCIFCGYCEEACPEIAIVLDQVIPPIPEPASTKYVKHEKLLSERLSKFWGRPMYLGAHVLLPEGYDTHPNARYPLVINHGHFPDTIGGGLPSVRPIPAAAQPEWELSIETTTGMSAPPMPMTRCQPMNSAAAVISKIGRAHV